MNDAPKGDSEQQEQAAPAKRPRSFVIDGLRVITTNFVHIGAMIGFGLLTARIWGAEMRGVLAVIMVVPGLLGDFFDLGMKKVIPRRLGRSDDAHEYTLGLGVTIWIVSSIIAMAIAGAYALFFTNLDVPFWWHLIAIVMIMPIRFTEMSRGAALGVQDIGAFNRMFWLRDPIPLLGVIALGLILGTEAWAYLAALFIAHTVSSAIGFHLIRKHGWRKPIWDAPGCISLLKEGIVFSMGMILMRLSYMVNVLILGFMLSWVIANGATGWFESRGSPEYFKVEIGNYSVGVALAQMIWQVPIALGHVLFSRSVNTTDDFAFAKKTARLVRSGFVVLIPGAAVLYLVAPWLIPWAYGEDFVLGGSLTQLLMPGIVAFFAARMFEADLTGKGYPMQVVYAMAPTVALNIVLSVILIPTHGVIGASIASSISYVLGTIALAIIYSRITHVPIRDMFIPKKDDFRFGALAQRLKAKLKRP